VSAGIWTICFSSAKNAITGLKRRYVLIIDRNQASDGPFE
jgi:hypothetical protein